ncbi:MAG: hypothetical protein IT559_05700 [Alphaproteobacteria bacterium]|nr:hypothetical protein [Alphaproteobacteria bacterium]
MPENLEPIKTGNGVAGQYKTSSGPAYFSLLIADNASKHTLEESVAAAHEKIAQLKKQDNFSNKVKVFISSLRAEFTEPKVIRLNDDHELADILEASMRNGKDTIFACSSRMAYKKACQHMGITRADHLACAEMHAILIDQNDEKPYVAGSAHKIRDYLKKFRQRYTEHSAFIDPQKIFMTSITEGFIEHIPEAMKFNLGSVETPSRNPESASFFYDNKQNGDLFRLPFKSCFFEVDFLDNSGSESHIADKVFAFATEYGEDEYIAHLIVVDKGDYKRVMLMPVCPLWSTKNNKLRLAYVQHEETKTWYPEPGTTAEGVANKFLFMLLPFVKKLNDTHTQIINIAPPTRKRIQIGRLERDPYYDYHIIKPEPQEIVKSSPVTNTEPRRLHSRRGHRRTYKHPRFINMQGKTVWIKPKTWGDESKGVLGKEYDLSND